MSSDDHTKKKLYEFDSNYLKQLNEIRQQFNLDVIKDEDTESLDARTISLPSTRRIDNVEELYDCETDYMKTLNAIRKQLNMLELQEDGSKKHEEKEMKILFECRKKKEQSTKDIKSIETLYMPPKKKKCVRDRTPVINKLEQSKIENSKCEYQTRSPKDDVQQAFFSLNVPCTVQKVAPLFPKVTVLNEDGTLQQEEKTLPGDSLTCPIARSDFMVGLDLPKKSTRLYNFPSLVHLAKWAQVLNQDVTFDQIFLGVNQIDDQLNIPVIEMEKDTEIETISSLTNMSHTRRKQRWLPPYPQPVVREETIQESEVSESELDDEVKRCCQCFSICFNKKKKSYFT